MTFITIFFVSAKFFVTNWTTNGHSISLCKWVSLKFENLDFRNKLEVPDSLKDAHCLQPDYVDSQVSYYEFYCKYMEGNRPCILSSVENIVLWKAFTEWIVDNKLNYHNLINEFNKKEATVYTIPKCIKTYFDQNSNTTLMPFEIFLHKFSQNIESDDKIYLKDFHFAQGYQPNYFYQTPRFFREDWLNDYFINHLKCLDDYRFLYIGQKGSWTGLHTDVLASHSWSVNLCGSKRWLLFPPGQEKYLATKSKVLPSNVFAIIDINSKSVREYYDIIQKVGEIIFVPSGWYHQVINLEDTLSINHNVINGSNIEKVWIFFQKSLDEVKHEIKDLQPIMGKDWESHCQIMLKALISMDYTDFFELLTYVCQRLLEEDAQNFWIKSSLNTLPILLKILNELNIAIYDNTNFKAKIDGVIKILNKF